MSEDDLDDFFLDDEEDTDEYYEWLDEATAEPCDKHGIMSNWMKDYQGPDYTPYHRDTGQACY